MGARIINRQRVLLGNPVLPWMRGLSIEQMEMVVRQKDRIYDAARAEGFSDKEATDAAYASAQRFAEGLKKKRNPPRITQRDVNFAAAQYHNNLMEYGENNMATQRAEFRYRDLKRAYEAQQAKAAERRK